MVGNGKMGGFHAATLRSLPEVRELSIFDADPARRTVGTLEEALDGADCAVIVSPAVTHIEFLRICVDRGLPTFCEKPIALDLEKTHAAVDHVESMKGVVQMGFQRRFDRWFGEARRQIGGGAVGRVRAFTMATLDRTPPPANYVRSSGGLFKDMYVHDFDTVRWLFQEEVVEVYATGSVLVDEVFKEADDVDTAAVLLRLSDGTLGSLVGCRSNPAGYLARLDLYGSEDDFSIREERPYVDFLDRYPEAYRAELEHFLKVARGEAETACTARDALEALRLAVAADASRRSNRPVMLAEIP